MGFAEVNQLFLILTTCSSNPTGGANPTSVTITPNVGSAITISSATVSAHGAFIWAGELPTNAIGATYVTIGINYNRTTFGGDVCNLYAVDATTMSSFTATGTG